MSVKVICDFLSKHAEALVFYSQSGLALDAHMAINNDNELLPDNFLEFARDSLEHGSKASLHSVLAFLKQTIDCQLDDTLNSIGITRENAKRYKLGSFPEKLKFISCVFSIPVSQVSAINKIRNDAIHNYTATLPRDTLAQYYEITTLFSQALYGGVACLASAKESAYLASVGNFYAPLNNTNEYPKGKPNNQFSRRPPINTDRPEEFVGLWLKLNLSAKEVVYSYQVGPKTASANQKVELQSADDYLALLPLYGLLAKRTRLGLSTINLSNNSLLSGLTDVNFPR